MLHKLFDRKFSKLLRKLSLFNKILKYFYKMLNSVVPSFCVNCNSSKILTDLDDKKSLKAEI